jgi:hypothetical protein
MLGREGGLLDRRAEELEFTVGPRPPAAPVLARNVEGSHPLSTSRRLRMARSASGPRLLTIGGTPSSRMRLSARPSW